MEEDHRSELQGMSEGHAARLVQEKAVRDRKVVLLQVKRTPLLDQRLAVA